MLIDSTDHRTTSQYWQLKPTPKYSTKAVARCAPPSATVRRAKRLIERIGVTQVAEVTGLDSVGIPNFMTVRPRDLGPGISYYNGKGTTRQDALAGALMEAVERQAGEHCDYPVTRASQAELAGRTPLTKLAEIVVPNAFAFDEHTPVEWVHGYDLIGQCATATPLNAVMCPYTPTDVPALFYASTNGLASGNTLTEALCHALCEVIERDALAISLARSQVTPAIGELLESIGISSPQSAYQNADHAQIRLEGLPRRAALLVGRLKRAGLSIYVRNLTSTAGLATIDCTIVEPTASGIPNAHGGCGTHPDARIALNRAITEAAQSRIACIQGGREDLPEIIKPRTPYDADELYGGTEFIDFDDVPSVQNARIDEDIRLILDRMPDYGLDQAVAFDLTRPDVGMPVVRVVVPKAEAWSVFHLHTGRGVFGERVSQVLQGAVH
ncbi:YcaO-related McrA-glycine thioamidation protein [Roseibium sp. ROS1]